tara:strand:+ start:128 stop:1312 length:1185 start_codon:yes stop_codon:yes gene_type:complete
MPITWRNVGTTNPAALLNAGTAAAEQLGQGISDIGAGIDQYADARTTSETNAFLTELMQAPDQGARDNMINDANTAFLNMETINTENYTLGQPERDKQVKLEDEKRALTTAKDILTFEDDISDKNLIEKIKGEKDVLNYQDSIFDANYNIENSDQITAAQLKYSNDQNLIIQNHEKALLRLNQTEGNAGALKISLDAAAKKQELELKKLADEYKLKEIQLKEDIKIEAARLAKELGKKTGLGLAMFNQSGGVFDEKELGMKADDFSAFAAREQELKAMGIPKNAIDKWVGQNIVFHDNGIISPNDFSFQVDGDTYKFGTVLQSEQGDLEAMAAAILNFENDLAQRATASKAYNKAFPDRKQSDFDKAWFAFDKKMLLQPNNAETFMAELANLTN